MTEVLQPRAEDRYDPVQNADSAVFIICDVLSLFGILLSEALVMALGRSSFKLNVLHLVCEHLTSTCTCHT